MAKRPTHVTVGGTQFRFSDQTAARAQRRSPLITVNNDGLPVSTSAGWVVPDSGTSSAEPERPRRRSWRPANGDLVWTSVGAVAGVAIVVGWIVAAIVLALVVVAMGCYLWSHRRPGDVIDR